MENSSKLKISEEYAKSLKEMLESENQEDRNLAVSILDDIDEEDKETVERYNRLIVLPSLKSLGKSTCWVIRLKGQIISANSRSTFPSQSAAMNHLSRHFTNYIGVKGEACFYRHNSSSIWDVLKKKYEGGKQLRDYLIKNNLITIEEVK